MNGNVVVYEGMLKDKELDPKKPIDVYWLDIDPDYVKAARKAGRNHDRQELSYIDTTMAYGATPELLANKKGVKSIYKLKLVALPDRDVSMAVDDNGLPKTTITLNKNVECYLKEVFVETKSNFIGFPTVVSVTLTGSDKNTGEKVVEKIIK